MARSRHASLNRLARSLSGVFLLGQAYEAGISRATVRWAERTGQILRLRQGVYTSAQLWSRLSTSQRHCLILVAHQRVDPRLIGYGLSAAAALGWPLPDDDSPFLPRHATAVRNEVAAGPAARPALRRRVDGEEVLDLSPGPLLAAPISIVVDCARLLPPEWGLAVADAALAGKQVQLEELLLAREGLAASGRVGPRGVRHARWVLEHARERVESPLESLARAVIVRSGFDEPEPQCWVDTFRGPYRVDLLDHKNRVITEADGKVKYQGDESKPLWREKQREDALRDAHFEVVRFTMADFYAASAWAGRYGEALHRARRWR